MAEQGENNKSSKSNQSVEKVFNIIELLAEKGEPMRILDIARELDMNTSTVLRFLATLESCGYVSQDQMLRTMQRIGNIAPIHCTGIGKLFLLDYPETKLDKLIEIKGLQRFTEHTLTSKEQIVDQLAEISELGYAYDNEECEVGARCIAFPIRDYTEKVVAGISVTGPVSRLTDTHISNRLKYILDISNEISKKLGYNA